MIRINLLPVKKTQKRNAAIMQIALIAVALVVTVAACYGWVWYYDGQIENQQAKIAEADEEIKRLKKIIGEVNQLEKQREALKKQLGVIDKLERGKRGPVHVLDELSTNIPKRVWITRFSEKGGALDLVGVGLENADISEFMRAMQKSKYFSNVQLGFTQSQKKNGVTIYNFRVTARVNYSA